MRVGVHILISSIYKNQYGSILSLFYIKIHFREMMIMCFIRRWSIRFIRGFWKFRSRV